jgi:hypothetical protein
VINAVYHLLSEHPQDVSSIASEKIVLPKISRKMAIKIFISSVEEGFLKIPPNTTKQYRLDNCLRHRGSKATLSSKGKLCRTFRKEEIEMDLLYSATKTSAAPLRKHIEDMFRGLHARTVCDILFGECT